MQLEDENAQRRTAVRIINQYYKDFSFFFDSDINSSTNGYTFITKSNGCTRTNITISICN
jgi:hypothetical protein